MNHLLDTVKTVYDPETTVAQITLKQSDHCIEILTNAEYNCIAGAANPDTESDMTLERLAGHALDETTYKLSLGKAAIIGPNPYVPGVGIWVPSSQE